MDLGLIEVMVSSTNLFHDIIRASNCRINVPPNSSIKILAITGPQGEPIAAPSHFI